MPQKDKSVQAAKQQPQAKAVEKGHEQKGVAGPQATVRPWATGSKLNGAGKIALGRKIPSGPVGGSGRKTNLSRSS